MKKIFKASVLIFVLAFMLNACAGSDDSVKPVMYDMFDSYDTAIFPQSPWINYVRTSGSSWIPDNWSVTGIGEYYASLTVPSGTQNSAFINTNYDKTDVNCSMSIRMSVNLLDPLINDESVGVILRADDSSYAHYALVYYVDASTTPVTPYVTIQKVDSSGTIHTLGAPVSLANYLNFPFNQTIMHTYKLSVIRKDASTMKLVGYIDGIQQIPAYYDSVGAVITPANPDITDDGSVGGAVFTSGKPGFFVENAITSSVTRFFMWEP